MSVRPACVGGSLALGRSSPWDPPERAQTDQVEGDRVCLFSLFVCVDYLLSLEIHLWSPVTPSLLISSHLFDGVLLALFSLETHVP